MSDSEICLLDRREEFLVFARGIVIACTDGYPNLLDERAAMSQPEDEAVKNGQAWCAFD